MLKCKSLTIGENDSAKYVIWFDLRNDKPDDMSGQYW